MGSKQTKIEGTYLPDTPIMQRRAATLPRRFFVNELPPAGDEQDPRSPSGFRTPIQLYQAGSRQTAPVPKPQVTETNNENTFGALRKRFLKNFSFIDPRSPQLNRTPMIFDDAVDRTLNLNDTFADLFVESRAPTLENNREAIERTTIEVNIREMAEMVIEEATSLSQNNGSLEIVSMHEDFDSEATMACSAVLLPHAPTTPVELPQQQQKIDPRSPTVGVDRTPIIFTDDDEANESQMLEDILETLTLNLSNDSSMASFVSGNSEPCGDMPASQSQNNKPILKPNNKHLERVRFGNKQRVLPSRKPIRRQCQQQQKQVIYDDNENHPQTNATSTPIGTPTKPKSINSPKRTPLSCVKNRAHIRSRSVEHTRKSLGKPTLPLQSFDDQLNPSACGFVPSLHILQNAEDFWDAGLH